MKHLQIIACLKSQLDINFGTTDNEIDQFENKIIFFLNDQEYLFDHLIFLSFI